MRGIGERGEVPGWYSVVYDPTPVWVVGLSVAVLVLCVLALVTAPGGRTKRVHWWMAAVLAVVGLAALGVNRWAWHRLLEADPAPSWAEVMTVLDTLQVSSTVGTVASVGLLLLGIAAALRHVVARRRQAPARA